MNWIDIFISIGPVYAIIQAIFALKKKEKLLQSGYKVEGEIVELIEDDDLFYPVISFVTITGKRISEKYREENFSKTKWKSGDKIEVYYDPQKPEKFIIITKMLRWAPYIIIGSSIVFLILCFMFIKK